jgi:hypothetical protein
MNSNPEQVRPGHMHCTAVGQVSYTQNSRDMSVENLMLYIRGHVRQAKSLIKSCRDCMRNMGGAHPMLVAVIL